MNRICCIIILVCFLSPLFLWSQQIEGYAIKGHIAGLEENEKISMQILNESNQKLSAVDSAYAKNGMFHLNGHVPDGPRLYFMCFSNHRSFCRILIDNNENITVQCDSNISKIKHIYLDNFFEITGSGSNFTWHSLLMGKLVYNQQMHVIEKYFKGMDDSAGFVPAIVNAFISTREQLSRSLFSLMFNTRDTDDDLYKPALPFNLISDKIYLTSRHSAEVMNIYKNLDEHIRENYYGRMLKDFAELSVGQLFPDFTLFTPEGKTLRAKDVITKSKMTVIHFWSVRSQDREKYQDELLDVYKKYHEKGLNIIGVFHEDRNQHAQNNKRMDMERQWKEIIAIDKFPWNDVADLKGPDGPVAKTYHEDGPNNTTNVLVNREGKIVAWDARGVELKYYLWKEFEDDRNKNPMLGMK